MQPTRLTTAEAAALDAVLPPGMTEDMREVAWCLFEALAAGDARAGSAAPDGPWLAQLQAWAQQVERQISNLADKKGGYSMYVPKLVSARLSPRDRQMCAEFRGDYKALARKYHLTPMRVRQIVDAWQRERFARAQSQLPGL